MSATPRGFRDILPEEALVREDIADTVRRVLREAGYLPVETPLLEDRAALEGRGRAAETPFQLFDDDGRLMVVRPDNTRSVARLVTARLREAALPLRLRLRGARGARAGCAWRAARASSPQLGFELIGAGGAVGDAEAVRLVLTALQALDISDVRLVCGSVRPFTALLAHANDAELARDALALVHANNLVDLDERVAEAGLAPELARAISQVPRLAGGVEVLDEVDALSAAAGAGTGSTDELRALLDELARTGVDAAPLTFDFSVMSSFAYYTGLVLEVYAAGLADPVGSGGRYDATFEGRVCSRAARARRWLRLLARATGGGARRVAETLLGIGRCLRRGPLAHSGAQGGRCLWTRLRLLRRRGSRWTSCAIRAGALSCAAPTARRERPAGTWGRWSM